MLYNLFTKYMSVYPGSDKIKRLDVLPSSFKGNIWNSIYRFY